MKNKIAISTFIVIFVGVVSKLIGFVRDMFVAMFLGAGIESDAFQIAQALPFSFFGAVALSVTTLYVTVYGEVNNKFGENEALRFSNQLLFSLVLFSMIVSIFGFISAPILVSIFAPGFYGEGKHLAIYNTRIAFLSVVLHFYIAFASGYLNYKRKFFVASLKGIFMNICLLALFIYLLFSNKMHVSIHSLMFMIILGLCLYAFLLTWYMKRAGYRFSFSMNKSTLRYVKKFYILIFPILIGVGVVQLAPICDRMIASFLEEGSVSALSYGGRLTLFSGSIIATGIITVIYPQIVQWLQYENVEAVWRLIKKYLIFFQGAMIPLTLFMLVHSEEIVKLFFGRGNFTDDDVAVTANVVKWLCLALPFYGVRELYVKIFHALQDTRTPVKNGVIVVVLNVMFSLVLSKVFGVAGIALGTSLSLVLMTISLHHQLIKKLYVCEKLMFIWKDMVRMMVSAVVAVIVPFLFSSFLLFSLYSFLTLLFIYFAIYLLLCFIMKVSWTQEVKAYVRRKEG